MPRHIVLAGASGTRHLEERLADDEAQLQEKMKEHPELLPIEEFGFDGPLMVVGRETSLPSGAADLVGLARGGQLLVVEFKTGPQNSDFRHTLAQLLDYGAALWKMDPSEFESTVALRYLASDRCPADAPARGATSLSEAAQATWPDLSEEDLIIFSEGWRGALADGEFHYVVAAQRFTDTMTAAIEYLNHLARTAAFYAVELVRFSGEDLDAFEGRSVVRPSSTRPTSTGSTSRDELLRRVGDDSYRVELEHLLDFCRGQNLAFEWGSQGVSIRLRIPDAEPITIAWLYPPGASGWLGLRDLVLGFDQGQARRLDDGQPLSEYASTVSQLQGATPATSDLLTAWMFRPEDVKQNRGPILEAIADLTESVAARG